MFLLLQVFKITLNVFIIKTHFYTYSMKFVLTA